MAYGMTPFGVAYYDEDYIYDGGYATVVVLKLPIGKCSKRIYLDQIRELELSDIQKDLLEVVESDLGDRENVINELLEVAWEQQP